MDTKMLGMNTSLLMIVGQQKTERQTASCREIRQDFHME
jgi:hypothetical protein